MIPFSILIGRETKRWVLKQRGSPVRKRVLSSWSRHTITAVDRKDVTLEIQQQFMAPPGGASADSTGRHIWPSARPLLQHMLTIDQKEEVSDARQSKTVLELGSGCGFVGMGLVLATMPNACSLLSTSGGDVSTNLSAGYQVVMTDHSTEWLAQNVARNQGALSVASNNAAKQQDDIKNIEVHKLQWGDQKDMQCIYETSHILRHKKSDGGHATKQFDYIIGSDLLYNPVSQDALVATLKFFSSSSSLSPSRKSTEAPIILMSFPQRQSDEERFVALAERNGFSVRTEPLVAENDDLTAMVRKEYTIATLEYIGP